MSRGFTLTNLLVALILFGMIGLTIVRIIVGAERSLRALRGHASLQAAFDLGTTYLDAELSDLGRDEGPTDLTRTAPESLSYRATRATGLACRVSATEVVLSRAHLYAPRSPQPGRDSLLLFLPPASAVDSPARWQAFPVTNVGSTTCGTSSAIRVGTQIDTTGFLLPDVPALIPARIFEVMQARLYTVQGERWLGARSETSGEGIQPLAGPFIGLESGFTFRDSAGGVASSLREIRSIDLRLAGSRPGWGRGGAAVMESVTVRVSPRNLWH